MTALRVETLHASFADAALRSMTFLNEVAQRYPDALSFAAGRPTEMFFEVDALTRYLGRFCEYLRDERRLTEDQIRTTLFQYGPAKGIIGELIARYLRVDERIAAAPTSIVVTVGCQEALFLVLRALRATADDVLLAVAPTYVGLTGAARLLDLPVWPVASGTDGIDIADLRRKLRCARTAGLRPRGCYVAPDFANPSGLTMPYTTRQTLLRVAADAGILLLEDNPYGLFGDVDQRPPTLKALDQSRSVVYLGSLAKSAFPGARIGFVVADQAVRGPAGESTCFADHLAAAKSMVTLNTSTLSQATVGGMLLTHGCSLARANVREAALYRRHRATMTRGLSRIAGTHGCSISWNAPRGGFFVVVTVPFDADDIALAVSAERFGVLWTPMAHFYTPPAGRRQIRLAVSGLREDQIDEGLDRLAEFVLHYQQRDGTPGPSHSASGRHCA